MAKFSVVTISYNQDEFLERCIRSVIDQSGVDLDYIIVDAGSTDLSRRIISDLSENFSKVVFEPDDGAADGLNKGFKYATGDVFCYLNSDDEFLPDTFSAVSTFFENHPEVDVLVGHAWVADELDRRLRRIWSDPFRKLTVAYGAAIQIQPSTFIRRQAFLDSGGFNSENRSNWDGELLISLFNSGAKIEVFDRFCSIYRVHADSITGSGKAHSRILEWNKRRFYMLMGRWPNKFDAVVGRILNLYRVSSRPLRTWERLIRGPVYLRKAK